MFWIFHSKIGGNLFFFNRDARHSKKSKKTQPRTKKKQCLTHKHTRSYILVHRATSIVITIRWYFVSHHEALDYAKQIPCVKTFVMLQFFLCLFRIRCHPFVSEFHSSIHFVLHKSFHIFVKDRDESEIKRMYIAMNEQKPYLFEFLKKQEMKRKEKWSNIQVVDFDVNLQMLRFVVLFVVVLFSFLLVWMTFYWFVIDRAEVSSFEHRKYTKHISVW